MSDDLITRLRAAGVECSAWPADVNPPFTAWSDLLDEAAAALEGDALSYISTAVTEHGREFDNPLPADDVIPWTRHLFGECPPSGTINGNPWHRVKRTILYGPWRDDP